MSYDLPVMSTSKHGKQSKTGSSPDQELKHAMDGKTKVVQRLSLIKMEIFVNSNKL